MLRIASMGEWSVAYYEKTAVRNSEYGGGLSEYYSERDTRAPAVFVFGDREFAEETMGVTHGSGISADQVTNWFQNAISPAGPGVGKPRPGLFGHDLLVSVPKSLSIFAATADAETASKMVSIITRGMEVGMQYLHQHAGYTRVTNKLDPKRKDLERLPSMPVVAYYHHTARPARPDPEHPEYTECDPHEHIHLLLPGRIARKDGRFVAIDTKSMYHESKAAGMIMQKMWRDLSQKELGLEFGDVDPHTGIAELAGIDRDTITLMSRRRSAMLDWAEVEHVSSGADRLADLMADVNDDEAAVFRAGKRVKATNQKRLDYAQRDSRQKKGETMHYDELRAEWRADPRLAHVHPEHLMGRFDPNNYIKERDRDLAFDVFAHLGETTAAWTRADLVEATIGYWPTFDGVNVPTLEDIEAQVDQILAEGGYQCTEDRQPWEREGKVRYTDAVTLNNEERLRHICNVRSAHLSTSVHRDFYLHRGLTAQQAEVMVQITESDRLVNILQGPAGSRKTTSLKAFRERVEADGKRVVLVSTAKSAVNEAKHAGAASEARTIASVRLAAFEGKLDWDHNTIVLMDEAGMTGNTAMFDIIDSADRAGAKIVAIGDASQLEPVRAGGGLFARLYAQLPWSQSFGEVFRQVDPKERAMTLQMRDANTTQAVAEVANWYSQNDRLRAGDEVSMADALVRDYCDAIVEGNSVMAFAQTWDIADPLNLRIQRIYAAAYGTQDTMTIPIGHQARARVGDIVVTTENDFWIQVTGDPNEKYPDGVDSVSNKDRWRVQAVHADGTMDVKRLSDQATAHLPAAYVEKNVVLGYVGTFHAAQGATVHTGLAIGDPEKLSRHAMYPGMTRGTHMNRFYAAVPIAGQDEHHMDPELEPIQEVYSRDEARSMFFDALMRHDEDRTALQHAERALREMLEAGRDPMLYQDDFRGVHPYVAQLVFAWQDSIKQWNTEWAEEVSTRDDIAQEHAREQAHSRELARRRMEERDAARERGQERDARANDDGAIEL
ncbi:MobF family relaxase [Mycobacteroides abscessus]|uniref:MobF family relaxase n=2 Tax=Mycobacteroides abscessus TaxID=36809 RepID=UPI000E689E2F|nr:MobF family relaxase [Mycobacteroides abscessus]RIS77900.1 hypothetical protein D2E54_15210 [Mycobacteroides abscessus]